MLDSALVRRSNIKRASGRKSLYFGGATLSGCGEQTSNMRQDPLANSSMVFGRKVDACCTQKFLSAVVEGWMRVWGSREQMRAEVEETAKNRKRDPEIMMRWRQRLLWLLVRCASYDFGEFGNEGNIVMATSYSNQTFISGTMYR